MSDNVHHVSHGNTKAAWTGTGILLLASLLICLGLVFAMPALWIPGIIGVPLGAFTWAAMNRAGYGEEKH
ncbi:MAG: HGxxPAAW family protein [Dermatophilus congolensis]|nr:HGxxPAAW family protein [Dermatophilus congolensis]